MYLRQMTYKYIIREETVVSMTPECRFPLKQNLGFLYIGTAVSTLRNYGVKPPGILTISYHFCKKHGERQEEYLNSNNYGNIPKNKNGITKLIKMLDMMANKNKDHEYLVSTLR